MLTVAQGWTTMLRGSGCLSSHLELTNLPIRKTTIVVIAVVRVILRLRLLVGLGLRGSLVHGRVGRFAVAREINSCWCGRYLALCLEQAGLKVDDVVAKLVVLGLQRLV